MNCSQSRPMQVDGVRTEDVTTARVDFNDAPLGIEHQQNGVVELEVGAGTVALQLERCGRFAFG